MTANSTSLEVNVSLAALPGMRHEWAANAAITAAQCGMLVEPLFGPLHVRHLQLVPQCTGQLTEDLAHSLVARYPGSQFRLHANVRVLEPHVTADLSNFPQHLAWFSQAARVSRTLGAAAYSAHAGRRSHSTLAAMLDNARRVADLFGCPVAVEGLYPTPDDCFLVSTWPEYQVLLESGVPFALDLSHMNILARQSGQQESALVLELLASGQCIEVHVSDNDGRSDTHQVCARPVWWEPLLARVNSAAVIFSEGNHRRALLGGQP